MSLMPPSMPPLTRRERTKFLVSTLVRAGLATLLVLVLYYLLPIDHIPDGLLFLVLGFELVILGIVVGWQVRRVLNADTPLLAAITALSLTVPLFLVIFAAMYVGLSTDNSSNFNVGALSRTDALYFTVTVFATVGFGDITATSQLTRIVVTVQMLLDLAVLGLLIRVFFGAVQEAWKTKAAVTPDEVRDAVAQSVEQPSVEGSSSPPPAGPDA